MHQSISTKLQTKLRTLFFCLSFLIMSMNALAQSRIDRKALVERNCPVVEWMDTLSSLSVGNGDFAFTVDATGLQTFPEHYSKGICLGTQSSWGWHSFVNDKNLRHEETLRAYDFGHGKSDELYACQFKEEGRQHDASEYFRINPHRLHLGVLGFDFGKGIAPSDIKDIHQKADIWHGKINSHFSLKGGDYSVQTVCHPNRDLVAIKASNSKGKVAPICLRLPYPTGGHVDDACNWNATDKHSSTIIHRNSNLAVIQHDIDTTRYFIILTWQGKATLKETTRHTFAIVPQSNTICLSAEFKKDLGEVAQLAHETDFSDVELLASQHWERFWNEGAAVDFSHCKDARAKELERRVVLSQYLLAIQSAGQTPPQETGLTMNSWFGKFHLEMILWHQAWLPLWGHESLLTRTLNWYFDAENTAKGIARRQGFDGVRWMKMTDPSGIEAPSNVGSFLIWQQPHLIYLSELARRSIASKSEQEAFVRKMYPLVLETAKFMYSFATFDSISNRYILKGIIPAQESLKAAETYNPPFELNQWHYTLSVAQAWREAMGENRNSDWDKLINQLSPLAFGADSLYLAAESATDTYSNQKMISDHPALLGALGFFPDSRLIDKTVMNRTLDWIISNWNWPTSWGWDFPMTAMTATRLHQPEKAVNALLLDMQKNTYLNNGHNYQDKRLRLYLPGNGGLLSAIALMCAGWDGCEEQNPGFPHNGNWDVRWEGLKPLP